MMRLVSGATQRIIFVAALLLVMLPAVAYGESGTHTVQAGETLYQIATAHGTTTGALIRANGLANADVIRVGQKLKLPSTGSTSSPATSGSAGSSTSVGPSVPRGSVRYTVKSGDTLANIAARYGVSLSAIMRANGMSNANVLRTGVSLLIPSAVNTVAAPPSAKPAAKPAVKPATPGKTGGSYNKFGGGPQNYLDPTRFAASISQQHCWLIQDNQVTGSWPCSTGRKHYETPPGFYTVQSKMPTAYGAAWNFYMPYWLGIYNLGSTENGIHGLPFNKWGFTDWKDEIGTPISFGCIVLDDPAAKKLYEVAYIGMQIIILK